MTRTNLRRTKKDLQALAALAVEQWEGERRLDTDHIKAHIEQTREDLEWIVQWEAQLVEYVRTTATQMRERIIARQQSLQGHLHDLSDDGEVIEAKPVKQINGGA